MAAPTVATLTEGAVTTAGTSHTVPFPASSASGDLIVALFCTNVNQGTMTVGDGFTLVQITPIDANKRYVLLYKQIDGSEGGDCVVTTGGTCKSAWTIHRITGHEDPATQAPEIGGSLATGTSTAPDAGTCTPTGGPKDFLYISGFALSANEEADDDTWVNTAPSGYTWTAGTAGHQKSTGTASAASTNTGVASGYKQTTGSSSDDAGAWAMDLSLAWFAATIAVHPAAAATPGPAPFRKMRQARAVTDLW